MGSPLQVGSINTMIIIAILLLLQAIYQAEKSEELELGGTFSSSSYGSAFVIPNPVNEALLRDQLCYVPSSPAGRIRGLACNFTTATRTTTSKLWKNYEYGSPRRLASFNTSFPANMSPVVNYSAYLPPSGEGLSLLNRDVNSLRSRSDADSSGGFIAMELHIIEQHFGSFVGDIQIPSLRSMERCCKRSGSFRRKERRRRMHLRAYMEEDRDENEIGSTSSSNASKGRTVHCKNQGQWNVTVGVDLFPLTIIKNKNSNKLNEIITRIVVPGLTLLLIGIGCLTWKRGWFLFVRGVLIHFWWKNEELETNVDLLPLQSQQPCTHSLPRTRFGCEFSFNDLKKATNNFDEKNKIGEGSFGVFYSGVLPKDGFVVAIKRFFYEDLRDQDDFLSELSIIHGLHHPNVVPLLGWCHKNGMWLMVYEYMPNGSLDKYLYNGATMQFNLNWQLRHKIIRGVASALAYLHSDPRWQVVHGVLKPSNIMLDCDFNAHLGDFVFSRGLENKQTSCGDVSIKESSGYIAPECLFTRKATCQADIYSFGAMVLEVICSRRIQTNIEGFHTLVDWIWWLHRQGRILEGVDEMLVLHKDYMPEEAERLLLLGLACAHPIASERPKAQDLIDIISGKMAVHIPPVKPAFVWHSAAGTDTSNHMNIEIVGDPSTAECPSENTESKRRKVLLPAVFCILPILPFKALREHRFCIRSHGSQATPASLNNPGCTNVGIKSDTTSTVSS